jgi:hypothetical protein
VFAAGDLVGGAAGLRVSDWHAYSSLSVALLFGRAW